MCNWFSSEPSKIKHAKNAAGVLRFFFLSHVTLSARLVQMNLYIYLLTSETESIVVCLFPTLLITHTYIRIYLYIYIYIYHQSA
jgi:hypothetical protein